MKTKPIQTTKQGQPTVIFDMHDYMHTLTVDWKYTLVRKISTTMPKMEFIRESFIQHTQLNKKFSTTMHVFIELQNELDYNTLWTQRE